MERIQNLRSDWGTTRYPAVSLLIVLCLFLNGCPNPNIIILFRTESGSLKNHFTIRSSDKLTTIRFSGLGLFGSTHNEDYSLRFGFRIDQDDTTQVLSVDLNRITILFEDSAMKKVQPKFVLGQTVSTSNALNTLNQEDVLIAMGRHHRGDWCDLCDEDRQANEQALERDLRLFSVYRDREGTKFYISTEHDRSVTTVLLPEDY